MRPKEGAAWAVAIVVIFAVGWNVAPALGPTNAELHGPHGAGPRCGAAPSPVDID